MSGFTVSNALLNASVEVISTCMHVVLSGRMCSDRGGLWSMTAMTKFGCFSARARTMAEPTKPVPPDMRTLLAASAIVEVD